MCGICGIWDYGKITDRERKLIGTMNSSQAHRGPDDVGEYYGTHVALGHRRLSILDLTKAGHQPLCYMDRFWISYNGEIYNYIEIKKYLEEKGYTFKTSTDTEVICAAYDFWGTECFKRFNGFWALAIYDVKEGRLCLSRDRYGVKPLYYYMEENGRFVFASEMKAILCDSRIERKVNREVIADYLVYGLTDHTEKTFFQNIYVFPAATYTVLDKKGVLKFHSYYKLKINYNLEDSEIKEKARKFRNLFKKSVELRLRSDVEIGACLSGGLDSSAIVCMMNRLYKENGNKEFKTFSACFEGFRLDESEYINEVLKCANLHGNHKVSPTAKEFWADLDHLIFLQDQPFLSAGAYLGYYLMKAVNANGIKVMLDGQGADEILCGYRKSRIYLIKQLLKNRKIVSALKEGIFSIGQFATSDDLYSDIRKIYGLFFGKNGNSSLYIKEPYAKPSYDYSNGDFIRNDISKISLPGILRIVDRNSMAFSIEDRLPFLDYNLVDFSISLPLQSKIKNGWSKYIMRCALELPEKIKYRKTKIGFVPPEVRWLEELHVQLYKVFSNENFRADEFIDRDRILQNWDKIVCNPDQIPLFRFICLEKWMQVYNVKS